MSTQLSTQRSAPYVFSRVAARAGLGIWRHRVSVLIAAIVVVGLGTYVTTSGAGRTVAPLAISGATGGDCADTAMAAIADKSTDAASRAYQCMDPSFQQRVPEAQFVRQMQQQALPNIEKLQRVGDYHPSAGGTMVYYAVDGGSQTVGYIVYLGDNGKVVKIE
jgi:hypothetical protein